MTTAGRFGIALASLVILALAARLLIFAEYAARNPNYLLPTNDGLYYWELAEHGFDADKPYLTAPLYPMLLGLLRSMGGGLRAAYLIQLVLHAITGIVIGWTAFRRRGFAVGLVSAGLFFCLFDPAFYCFRISPGTLQVLLVSLVWVATVGSDGRRSLIRLTAGGLALGVLCAAYAPAILLVPGLGFWLLLVGGWKRALLLVVLAMGTMAPVTLRNYRACGELIAISAHSGITFRQGNGDGAEGIYLAVPGVRRSKTLMAEDAAAVYREATGREGSWREVDRYFWRESLVWWADNPADALLLASKKAYWFLTGRYYHDIYHPEAEKKAGLSTWTILTPMPIAWITFPALLVWCRKLRTVRKSAPEILLVAVPFVTVLVFWYSPRYRLPATPVLVALAAEAGALLYEWRKHRLWGILALLSVLAGIALPGVNAWVGFDAPERDLASGFFNMAVSQDKLGDEQAARQLWLKAVEADPNHVKSHLCLGLAFTRLRSLDWAEYHYRRAVEIDPDSAENRHLHALVLNGQSKVSEAMDEWRRALSLNPRVVDARLHLSRALVRRQRTDEAISVIRDGVMLDPGDKRLLDALRYLSSRDK
ncbi:MAG TPA: tetratricopeptide repeat protein [Phycisphaerae bacterium]|nr:tetratricopeptide repeat protein [Phycisphaerae bacterium]